MTDTTSTDTTRSDAFEADRQVAIARAIAVAAHTGQVDKLGAAYIDHPRRIAASLSDPTQQAIAWLHDVVEDTAISEHELLDAGVDERIIDAVLLLTRRPEVASDDYYAAIRANPDALAVKLADIDDNTLHWRVAKLGAQADRLEAKYANARRALTGPALTEGDQV